MESTRSQEEGLPTILKRGWLKKAPPLSGFNGFKGFKSRYFMILGLNEKSQVLYSLNSWWNVTKYSASKYCRLIIVNKTIISNSILSPEFKGAKSIFPDSGNRSF